MSCNMPVWELDLRGLECSKLAQILTGYSSTFLLHYCEEKKWFPYAISEIHGLKVGSITNILTTGNQCQPFTMGFSDFHLNLRKFEPRYLGETRELKALIPPIDSTHGYYWSWKYELHTPTISGQTKNRFHLLKSPIVFPMYLHCNLVSKTIVHTPNNLGVALVGGLSGAENVFRFW